MQVQLRCRGQTAYLWRGSLLPWGAKRPLLLGLLRSPAGASSLATKNKCSFYRRSGIQVIS